MYCPQCGTLNDDNAYKCTNCGRVLQGTIPTPPQPPAYGQIAVPLPNYLVQSILVTLFCCLPAGIVAIVYASQVNSKLMVGDTAGASVASRKARTWCWVSFGVGAGIGALWLLALAGGVFSGGFRGGF